MKFLMMLMIVGLGYYSLTYGIYLWKNESSKLPGIGVLLISVLGIVVPIIMLYLRV